MSLEMCVCVYVCAECVCALACNQSAVYSSYQWTPSSFLVFGIAELAVSGLSFEMNQSVLICFR